MTMDRLHAVAAPVVPFVHPDTQGFWDGLAEGELRIQVCSGCQTHRFPFGPVCFRCLSYEHTWQSIAVEGTVVAAVVVRRATGDQVWAERTPFLSGLVDMKDGPRLPGSIRCTCGGGLERGAAVRAMLLETAGGEPLYTFAHTCIEG
jgi:hypothetical protein